MGATYTLYHWMDGAKTMKKTNPTEISEQLLDYRDIPTPEINPTLPADHPAFAMYTSLGEEFIFDRDKPRKVDFEA